MDNRVFAINNTTKGVSAEERAQAVANMAAAARDVFGKDVVFEVTPTGLRFPMGVGGSAANERPGQQLIDLYLGNKAEGDAFLARTTNEEDLDQIKASILTNVLRGRAVKLAKEKKYDEAARLCLQGAEAQCHGKLPMRRAMSRVYRGLESYWGFPDAMSCLNEASRYFLDSKNYCQALLWAQEAREMAKNARYEALKNNKSDEAFDWFDFNYGTEQYFVAAFRTFEVMADVYLAIGNTGAGVYYRLMGQACLSHAPDAQQSPDHQFLLQGCGKKLRETTIYRHPEPSLVTKIKVVDDRTHVYGSWRKIELRKTGGLTSRQGSAAFTHKGFLYVVGGTKGSSGPSYRETWRLNLSQMDKWQPLDPCPISEFEVPSLTSLYMPVVSDKAYYFYGTPILAYFDLKTLKWGFIRTTFKRDNVVEGPWPYELGQDISGFIVQAVGNKLYVFGGAHASSRIGCNLLLELDLDTRVFRRLSGFPGLGEPSYYLPGPRINPCSWVSKDQKNIYMFYGDADRLSAKLNSQKNGAFTSHGYDDLWSWNIEAEEWKREKMVGNMPSPRTEMACVYNAFLDKVITFGGYSPNSLTDFPQIRESFTYSYYADTFICDFREPKPSSRDRQAPSTAHKSHTDIFPSSWRQVLTRGFPTYRAQPHLVVDDTTGKTYLFSGYVNSEFVPSRVKSFSRSFADIWELRLDIPGGNFEDVDLEEEARTAKAGPWQRCFACGSTGPWKKCGGSCNGRVFFCNSQCLKDGWREHKQNHHCRRV